jgi:hypothetical protein|tara:strand:+ start:31073 stop:31321 length:249 start_codon:yes stop_codon:yes gene_type:complete
MKEQELRSIIRKEIKSALTEKVSATLTTKMDRVDKTQAMKMLKKIFASKPASQQAEFVANLVKNLNLKGNIGLLIKKIRKVN